MSKVIKFPSVGQAEQPEPQQNEVEKINFNEVDITEEDFVYEETIDYGSSDECYRCGYKFDFNSPILEQIWYIHGQAGYGSELEGSHISISICDKCMVDFISQKKPNK